MTWKSKSIGKSTEISVYASLTIPEENVFFSIHPLCADIRKFAFVHSFKKAVQYCLKVSINMLYILLSNMYERSHKHVLKKFILSYVPWKCNGCLPYIDPAECPADKVLCDQRISYIYYWRTCISFCGEYLSKIIPISKHASTFYIWKNLCLLLLISFGLA